MSATLADVARLAGVSPATVSRFLRGHKVRDADVVREAVASLKYAPNALAQNLKYGRTRSVAIVVPDVTNPFFASVVKGAEAESRAFGYSVSLYNTDEDAEREHEILSELVGRTDGVILAPVTESGHLPSVLTDNSIAVAFIDRETTPGQEHDTVLVDNTGGTREAGEYLLSLGHSRIAQIHGNLESTPGRERWAALAALLDERGIEPTPEYDQDGGFREEGGYQSMLRLMTLRTPPTAVFVANNFMTIGALRALKDLGIGIPGEVSLIGFDDLRVFELLTPPLTVVDRPTDEQGAIAMKLLLRKLREPELSAHTDTRRIVLSTRLIIRGSCAPPGTGAQMPP